MLKLPFKKYVYKQIYKKIQKFLKFPIIKLLNRTTRTTLPGHLSSLNTQSVIRKILVRFHINNYFDSVTNNGASALLAASNIAGGSANSVATIPSPAKGANANINV